MLPVRSDVLATPPVRHDRGQVSKSPGHAPIARSPCVNIAERVRAACPPVAWSQHVVCEAPPLMEHRRPRIDALRVIEFAEPGPLRDWLVALVTTGRKRATAALLSEWESAQDPLEVGRRWAVVDSAGQRVAVVETTELRIGTFGDVDLEWIIDAGEGQQSVEQWREDYLDQYERTTGKRPALATPVVYERFRLVQIEQLTT
jgi:uncharacterized protein YhfF